MATPSAAPTNADTLITLKVNLDGVTRRFKLPLRDLTAHTLEEKVRAYLHIPVEVFTTIERYSDSAGSFVTLNSANISVYKQLYRAAKAKQKLKLRVTTRSPPPKEEKEETGPKPVTVEDVPEAEQKSDKAAPVATSLTPVPSQSTKATSALDTMPAPQVAEDFPDFVKQWRARGMPRIYLRRNAEGVEMVDFVGPATPAEPMITLAPVDGQTSSSGDSSTSASYRFSQTASQLSFATLIREARERELADAASDKKDAKPVEAPKPKPAASPAPKITSVAAAPKIKSEAKPVEVSKSADSVLVPGPVMPTYLKRPFTVCCNNCDRTVPGAHFHCSICDDGDFDLCQKCVDDNVTCNGEGHWLIKRTITDGQIKCSTTHIAPKPERPASSKEDSPKPTGLQQLRDQVCQLREQMAPPSWMEDAEVDKQVESNYHELLQKLAPKLVKERYIQRLEKHMASRAQSLEDSTEKSPLPPCLMPLQNARTCNCCVQEYPEKAFLHCTTCEDYDLCKTCFAKDQHGHHPKHGFAAAVKGTAFEHSVSSRLAPGRNTTHNAICDGCDKYVRGVRHKCLDCPDWDYCSECVQNASFIHPGHRFVAIYEPLADRVVKCLSRSTHYGICCDGPLCSATGRGPKYIVGERYKCAVCHDTDFCANCEASPANTHNKTHPLIKFKTPVRHVSVTTTGEHEDGQRLPTMGDRAARQRPASQASGASSPRESIAATPVQTVVDVQPTEEPAVAVKSEIKQEAVAVPAEAKPADDSLSSANLVAVFKHDTVADGTVLPPNHTFEQTWVLRNEGTTAWPAGCAVKFVGGDYMGAVDPTHPAGIHELVSASESTVCYNALKPGQEFPFTVLMRTPDRDGKVISYWRLTTRDGVKFGHKLWCDVTVKAPQQPSKAAPTTPVQTESQLPKAEVQGEPALVRSQMIIPKLEHESPSSSMLENPSEAEAQTEADTAAPSADVREDDFDDCGESEDWADDSDDGFLTDEEYDILDASDEEFLSEQQKLMSRK
ncbi:hypothetical protein F4780DRAFT_726107 [Xylariomycetidae sp. FL0641]|nr:hypothetical protein F4780DRAFT_726107 [Xylariomycetidae sp. FL0641]